jgi:hypothetical protein
MQPNVPLTGERGEKAAEGEWHVLLQKYEDVEGGENSYARLEEDEGRLHVKVEDVMTIDVKVVTRGMGEAAMIKALGGEEIYSQMTRKETRRVTSGVDSYLPGAERESKGQGEATRGGMPKYVGRTTGVWAGKNLKLFLGN